MKPSHRIFMEAVRATKEENISVKGLAKKMEVPPSGLWYNARGDRKWLADNWLLALYHLGAVEFELDRIVIKTKLGKLYK